MIYSYFDKHYFSLNHFTGRSHDSRVFRNSPIYNDLTQLMHTPDRDTANTFHLLGDGAYPCIKQLLVPYGAIASGLTRSQLKFNRHLSSKRQVSYIRTLFTLCYFFQFFIFFLILLDLSRNIIHYIARMWKEHLDYLKKDSLG